MDENSTRQKEETDTLSAIYMDDFQWLDEGCFSISIKQDVNFTLTINLNSEYPDSSPPNYSIQTSGLSVSERDSLDAELTKIYSENSGEPIIYAWITCIQDFLYSLHIAPPPLVNQLQKSLTLTDSKKDKDEGEGERDGKKEEREGEEGGGGEGVESTTDYNYHEEYNKGEKSYDNGETDEDQVPPIYHTEHLKDRKSDFQGHLAPVFSKDQVDMVMASLKENKKIAAATHNILAYRIELGNGHYNSGCVDDGEFGASARMLNLLNIIDARNVMVVVTRWYGGIHLGPDRFKHINNITRDLLDEYGYIKLKANAKKNQKTNTENIAKNNKKNLKKR